VVEQEYKIHNKKLDMKLATDFFFFHFTDGKPIYIQKYQDTPLFSKQFTQRSAGFRTRSYKRQQVKQQHSHQQEVTP
jgi:hypothetical protein